MKKSLFSILLVSVFLTPTVASAALLGNKTSVTQLAKPGASYWFSPVLTPKINHPVSVKRAYRSLWYFLNPETKGYTVIYSGDCDKLGQVEEKKEFTCTVKITTK